MLTREEKTKINFARNISTLASYSSVFLTNYAYSLGHFAMQHTLWANTRMILDPLPKHQDHQHVSRHHHIRPLLAVVGVTGDGRGGPLVCCQPSAHVRGGGELIFGYLGGRWYLGGTDIHLRVAYIKRLALWAPGFIHLHGLETLFDSGSHLHETSNIFGEALLNTNPRTCNIALMASNKVSFCNRKQTNGKTPFLGDNHKCNSHNARLRCKHRHRRNVTSYHSFSLLLTILASLTFITE